MVRKITEREIIVLKDDIDIVMGILAEFNVDIVGKLYPQSNKKLVKLIVLIDAIDLDGLLEWFEKAYDGVISIME